MRTTLLPLLLVVSAAAGCIDLDTQYELKDLRILAMRLDPPEVLYSPFLSLPADQRPPAAFRPPPPFPPAEQELTATVLAVDPRSDAPVEFTSFVCPLDSNNDCRNYVVPEDLARTEREPEALQQALAPLVTRRTTSVPTTDDGGTLQGELGRFAFSERAIEYILPHEPSGAAFILLQQLGRIVTYAEREGIREVAFRRIPFGPYLDLSFLPPDVQTAFEDFLGIDVCTAEQTAARDPSCLWQATANRNPVIEEMRISRDTTIKPVYDEAGLDSREVGEVVSGPIALAPGEEIRLWPVLAADVREAYQSLNFDLQTSSLNLQNYVEDMAISWYATRDFPVPPVTDLTLSLGYSATYVYPEVDPPDEVRIYLVVLDQRGGVAWQMVVLTRG
ncbi:MAG: hypothetical protein ABIJ09_26780 [Pseudomonadota bacterium]